ncbi:MAG: hypothetical protein HY936_11515 [Nitrosomonadales bacterium]|nr:hypothetical protein [Nitrosomonadales bacterium]
MPIQNINAVARAGENADSSVPDIAPANKAGVAGSAPARTASTGLPVSEQPPSIAQLQRLIVSMNKAIQQSNSNLEFTMDKK